MDDMLKVFISNGIDELFIKAHKFAGTQSGDATDGMHDELNDLKEKLSDLIIRQVNYNQ